jgi:uncharacterized protein (TIGR00251 family)
MDFVEYIRKNIKNNCIQVKIIPNAKQTQFQEVLSDGTIKIRVASIPENGKANKKLLQFLQNNLRLTKDNISIISGETSQFKKIRIVF